MHVSLRGRPQSRSRVLGAMVLADTDMVELGVIGILLLQDTMSIRDGRDIGEV